MDRIDKCWLRLVARHFFGMKNRFDTNEKGTKQIGSANPRTIKNQLSLPRWCLKPGWNSGMSPAWDSPKGQDESRRKVLAVDWPAGIYGLRSKNRKGVLSLVHGGAALDASFHGWPSSAQPFHGGEWTCFIHKKYTDLTKLISENVLLWCCPSFFQDTPFFFSQGFYSQKH